MAKARYPIIAEDLIRRLESGEFGEERFPNFYTVVDEYKASNRTIQKAWNRLKAQGYIYTTNKGTYIKKRA